ncbi:MAG: hypothetical protein ABI266_02445 [Ginsengibacter sp.]
MKYLLSLCFLFLFSCNTGNTNNQPASEIDSPHPSKIETPADAIPGDMKIKHDSVVVPRDSILRVESKNQ